MAAQPSVTLENPHLRLRFDRQTGAWVEFTDRATGEELIAGQPEQGMLAPMAAAKLDEQRLRKAVADGKAVDLTGDWWFTPAPAQASNATAYLQGRFAEGDWQPTQAPSRRGRGDDRLHNRTGDFWYRHEFVCPRDWPAAPMTLVIGAVDDFDVTYLNGVRIGRTGDETPRYWEAPRLYDFPAALLRRDGTNTLLIKVTNGAYDGGIEAPVALGLASALRAPNAASPPLLKLSQERRPGANTLQLAARLDGWEYTLEYALAEDQPRFKRRLIIRNPAAQERVLQHQLLATPPLSVGPGQAVIFPGSLPVGDQPAARIEPGDTVAPRSQEPLAVLWDASKRRGLGVWHYTEDEFSPVSARRRGAGLEIRHAQQVIARLKPGETVALGWQHFWLVHGERREVLGGVQQLYREVGLQAPAQGLSRLREQVIYCGHPGGPPELNYRTYGGFKAIQAFLPTLKKMGVGLLWFLPIWEHGDGRQWNLYSPFDHFKVSSLYGTAEELRQLSAQAAQQGMRLMFDLVPHGPPDFTPLAKEHVDWVCRDANGALQYAWGQYAFDNAHPGWQDYLRRAAEWDAREFGAIGARVDCGAGSPPNWNPATGNRPSLSTLAGGLGMNLAIRQGFLKANRETVLLPEEYTGANVFNRVADLTYDAQLYFLMMDLQEHAASPEAWASSLQQFLHDQQITLPPGALKMRWISNHDTVSWTFQKQRPAKVYGLERMRALLALCALIEGVPMLYQGDEDPAVYGAKGAASVEFLARVYELRKRLPAIREGTADYVAASASGGVFACLRQAGGQQALVLVSFNPASVDSAVKLPSAAAGRWIDELSGESIQSGSTLRVSLAPHQTRVLAQTQQP